MYLSLTEIESIAAMVLADYYALPRFEGMQITHIDPIILAYELLGLEIKYHILSRSGSLLGLTAYGDAEVMVYDNDSQPHYERIDARTIFVDKYLRNDPRGSGRLHFTVMHENCHQIYKNLFPDTYERAVQERRIHYCRAQRTKTDWEEWRTDALAAAILMPPELVLAALKTDGRSGGIEVLNKKYASSEYKRFSRAAEKLGVSKTALDIRMRRMGLIGRDDFRNPYAMTDIFVEDGELDD